MRESIGATWIFSICLTFIVIFTAYIAISVNYSKAFRIKSYIVSQIEENEGLPADDVTSYLISQGYNVHGTCSASYVSTNRGSTDDDAWTLVGGDTGCIGRNTSGRCLACVYEKEISDCNSNVGNNDVKAKQKYYRVVTFFTFDLPIVNTLMNFEVSGESKLVYDIKSCS